MLNESWEFYFFYLLRVSSYLRSKKSVGEALVSEGSMVCMGYSGSGLEWCLDQAGARWAQPAASQQGGLAGASGLRTDMAGTGREAASIISLALEPRLWIIYTNWRANCYPGLTAISKIWHGISERSGCWGSGASIYIQMYNGNQPTHFSLFLLNID